MGVYYQITNNHSYLIIVYYTPVFWYKVQQINNSYNGIRNKQLINFEKSIDKRGHHNMCISSISQNMNCKNSRLTTGLHNMYIWENFVNGLKMIYNVLAHFTQPKFHQVNAAATHISEQERQGVWDMTLCIKN